VLVDGIHGAIVLFDGMDGIKRCFFMVQIRLDGAC
jgi:hypothetical protein